MEIFEDPKYFGVSFGRERGYGEIFKCLDQTTGNYVAVKKIVDYTWDIDVPSTKIRAVSFLKELNHDNIIRLLDILNLKDGVYIVLEYFDLDLYKFIYSRSIPKDQLQIENIQQQILSAVAYCHSNKIVHGDLRPENFLIDLDRSSYIVKLANFESARSLEGLPVGYGCQKMLYLELNQRISAEGTLEHYYFGSVKKEGKSEEIPEILEKKATENLIYDPCHKDESDLNSRREHIFAQSNDPHTMTEDNQMRDPTEPSCVSHYADEDDVQPGTEEHLVKPHGSFEIQDTSDLNSRREHAFAPSNDPDTVTEDNQMRDPTEPSCISHHSDRDDVQPGTEEHLVKPLGSFEIQDTNDLNSREHVFAPSNDPDTVTEDIQMRDPTEPSCVSHHSDTDDVQPGTEEHLVKPLGSFEIQDTSDSNSRREHLVVLPDDPDCVSEHPLEPSNEGWHFVQPLDVPPEDNLRSGPTEEPLKPSHGSHDIDKDEVQSG
ncbi:hypothetical protein L6164_026542 [Bauhinia variegata]|uniref:Uncharacterized protein n=1 Tax=Bauhinia variegata TaxID=167791 RepID=A0ACB9LQ39_BAUVA|nr:hypothetical protein L6164_026542 [Bauhinia variegata]